MHLSPLPPPGQVAETAAELGKLLVKPLQNHWGQLGRSGAVALFVVVA